jgi:hypothetical protein
MNPRVRHLFRLAVVLMCVGGLTALMVWALHGAHPSQRRSSFEDERYIAYRSSTDRGPTFSLDGKSGQLRVQSFLHLPYVTGPTTYSPERRYKYGLEFIVRDRDGEVVERRDTWMTTRNSKADWRDGRWQKAGTYYPAGESDGEPTDGRLATVDLRAWNDADHTVEIRMSRPDKLPSEDTTAAPPGAEVNLLVYRRFSRDSEERSWRQRTLSPKRRRELARRAGYERWHELNAAERDRSVRYGWQRLSTRTDTPVRTLYQTGFRVPLDGLAPRVGEPLRADEQLAYNLDGPATLHLGILQPPGTEDDGQPRPLRVSTVLSAPDADPPIAHERRSIELTPAPVPVPNTPEDLPDRARTSIDLPERHAGTVRLGLDDGAAVRVMAWLEGDKPTLGQTPRTTVADGMAMTGPDWLTFRGWEANPAEGPVEYLVAGDRTKVGQAVRITARPILPPSATSADTDAEAPVLIYEFTGDDRSRRQTITLEAEPAPFERLEVAGADDPTGRIERPAIGEPSYHRIWVPEWADRLRIQTDTGRAVVDLATLPSPDEYPDSKLSAPYAPPPERLTWRYAPHRVYPWQTLEPGNSAELIEASRRRQFEVQVRLEPDADAFADYRVDRAKEELCPLGTEGCEFAEAFDDEDDRRRDRTVVVRPEETLRGGTVVERADLQPIDRASIRRLASEWSASFRLGLGRGESVRCRAPGSRRVAIDYRLPDRRLLGEPLEVRWNGTEVTSTLMRVSQDRLVVDVPSRTGRLSLRVPEADDGKFRAYTDCRPVEPTDAAAVWRLRTVHALAPGDTMTVPVYTGEENAPGLNVIAYGEPGVGRFQLQSSVDGGDPPRRADGPVEQLTDPNRTLTFDLPYGSPIRMQRDPDTRLAGPTHQFVPLGTDWQPGWHEVELTLPEETADSVWLRFFLLTPDAGVARRNRGGR